MLVDTHFHLDLWGNVADIISSIERNRIYTIAVTNLPVLFENTHRLVQNTKYIRAAIGLHPELIESHGKQLDLFLNEANQIKYIGEIGLDYSQQNRKTKDAQRKVLNKIVEACAIQGNKVFSVHSRSAESDVITAFGPKYPGKVILHWYSGNTENLEKAIDYGMYFSVNHAMTISTKAVELISRIPLSKMLTESDGPFVNIGGMKASPLNIITVINKIGQILQREPADIMAQIKVNFLKLLNT